MHFPMANRIARHFISEKDGGMIQRRLVECVKVLSDHDIGILIQKKYNMDNIAP